MLFTHVEAAISQIQTAETELNAHSGLEHGSASIGASETALNIYLLDILKPFHMKHPGIRLKIYNHSTPQAIRSVKNGEVDFAVVSTPTNVDTSLKELHLRPVREILVGGKTFTALGSQELTLAELKNYPLICLGKETMTWNFYHKLFLSTVRVITRHGSSYHRSDFTFGKSGIRASFSSRTNGEGSTSAT